MPNAIISDTSCLILLAKIDHLDILPKLFGEITITPKIQDEFGNPLPNWIKVKSPENDTYQRILATSLDQGEAGAIALAIEETGCLLIMDDLKGRKIATHLNLNITGTLGVLINAKHRGIIDSIKPALEKIKQTDFRLTRKLEQLALRKSNE